MNYFEESEFTCAGELCFDRMDKDFISKLNKARSLSNHPFVITSSWRSEEHNRKVGGSKTSSHLKGVAVDLSAKSSSAKYSIVEALMMAGFARIGIGGNFIHVDLDNDKPQGVMWTY